MQGLLLVDKPKGWTSFDVVNYLRKIVAQAEGKKPKNTKVGHCGTLDPLATGLLVLVIGKEYTRRAGEFSKLDKTYEVTMKLGETSTTGDEEGDKTPYDIHQPACFTAEPQTSQASLAPEHFSSALLRQRTICTSSCVTRRKNTQNLKVQAVGQCRCHIPSENDVLKASQRFTGQIMQVPPQFSAMKINGQRAYKLARAGKTVELEARPVTIHANELTSYEYPYVQFTSRVSSGTYIRSLVEDIGAELKTGAYMSDLRRTAIGDFDLKDAIMVDGIDYETIQTNIRTI